MFAPHGAGDRTRTGTLSPAVDFESTTSTNSITPACNVFIILENAASCKCFFEQNLREHGIVRNCFVRFHWKSMLRICCGKKRPEKVRTFDI